MLRHAPLVVGNHPIRLSIDNAFSPTKERSVFVWVCPTTITLATIVAFVAYPVGVFGPPAHLAPPAAPAPGPAVWAVVRKLLMLCKSDFKKSLKQHIKTYLEYPCRKSQTGALSQADIGRVDGRAMHW
ncbi:hypothetical protein GJ744_007716 [Endocarpon pusillum]|uniref:Uncharacterized protein n=1 Tax=Endocarpon pusillum TaxID=364733 RepID=A0A8H7AYW1_9EURO|nr:hypothetical protein GJ744_007716 [Endocarpon pusillum]